MPTWSAAPKFLCSLVISLPLCVSASAQKTETTAKVLAAELHVYRLYRKVQGASVSLGLADHRVMKLSCEPHWSRYWCYAPRAGQTVHVKIKSNRATLTWDDRPLYETKTRPFTEKYAISSTAENQYFEEFPDRPSGKQ